MLAKKKEQKDKYDAAIKSAEDLYKAGKLSEAKSKFSEASTIDPSQTLPAQRIKQIDEEIADKDAVAKRKAQLDGLISEADGAFSKNELDKAKVKYQEVLNLDASNTHATNRIKEIDKKIAENQNQAERDAQFTALKTQGFNEFNQEKYLEAKQTLMSAKNIKADPDIDKKIAEIDKKLKDNEAQANLDAQYIALMNEAQNLENTTNFEAAITKYKEASSKKPNEALPKKKIDELNAKLESQKKDKAAQAEIDAKYNAEMKRGNDLMSKENYLDAIQAFNSAGAIKPNEKEPVDKAALAAQKESEKNTEKDKLYQNVLDAGQAAIDRKDWAKAIDMYNRAIDLKKDQTEFPKSKLAEIDKLKQEEENAKKGQAELEKSYTAKINLGESEAKAKKYDEAIAAFEAAQQLKPNESLPPKRIEELKEQKRSAQNAAQDEALYQRSMKDGDVAMKAKQYDAALTEFRNALTIKKNDKAASDKIAEIQQILDNLANANAKQKLQNEYNELIKEADILFNEKKFSTAQSRYEAALSRINNDSYALKQIDKCKAEMKANQAQEEAYRKKIAEADASYNKSEYRDAKSLYLEALEIKKGDSYVQQRLDELETLINPVITQSGPLPNLGIPTGNSIIDGEAALIKAEQKRKSVKASKVKKKGDKIDDENKNIQATKTQTILSSSNEIAEIEKMRTLKAISDDDSRLETVETVNTNRVFVSDEETKTSNFKYGENLQNTQYSADVSTEVNRDFEKSIAVYEDNTEVVKSYNIKITDEIRKDNNTRYEQKIDNQIKLSDIAVKIDENTIDDFESRKITETDVLNHQTTVTKIVKENDDKSAQNFYDIETSLENTTKQVVIKHEEDAKMANSNSEEVKVVQTNTVKSDLIIDETKSKDLLDADQKLASTKIAVVESVADADDNRLDAVEKLKEGNNDLYQKDLVQYNDLMVKALTNQDEIEVQQKANKGTVVLEEETKARNISGITQEDKKVLSTSKQNEDVTHEKRLTNRNQVEGMEIKVAKKATENEGNPNTNDEKLKSVNKGLENEGSSADKKQQDKALESRKLIEQFGKHEIKFDDKVANALGSQYPEGVSQESFEQLDEDGLLKAMVTRRVVVINGYGQVYVRTQTLTNTTYSKNGQPSSEHIWHKETSDAKLVKNY
jgi:epidermal growth factor receptor substrate 15